MDSMFISTGLMWKNFKFVLLFVFGLLAPIKGILILIGVFIVIDTVLGIMAAKKQKIKITSNRFSAMLSKSLVYQLIVIIAFAIDKLILGDFIALFFEGDMTLMTTKVTALFVFVNEGFSIDEKIKILRNGKGAWYHFKKVLGLAKLVKKETKGLITEEDEGK